MCDHGAGCPIDCLSQQSVSRPRSASISLDTVLTGGFISFGGGVAFGVALGSGVVFGTTAIFSGGGLAFVYFANSFCISGSGSIVGSTAICSILAPASEMVARATCRPCMDVAMMGDFASLGT